MMIKYKVSELAKDLGLSSHDVTKILGDFDEVPKKSATTLESGELDLVFEALTQQTERDSLDSYFARAAKPKVEPQQTKEPTAKRVPKKKIVRAASKKKEATRIVTPKPNVDKKEAITTSVENPEVRRIDTRVQQTEGAARKYDEKFDAMAQATGQAKGGRNTGVKKQRFNRRRRRMRSRRETEAQRLNRIADERKSRSMTIEIGDTISVSELALRLKATANEVIQKLIPLGIMASVNEEIDYDTAYIIAQEFHADVQREVVVTIEEQIIDDSQDEDENLVTRDPIVVVMGHVDHGKTSILDAIRRTSVTDVEAGGITQHIGAYRAKVADHYITFLDTPGHAAFTSMRARGAEVTDIAILVVAGDDGIMPQTIEAINHARSAGVKIIIAINKMDKPDANSDRIMQQLTEHNIVPEEWGGDTVIVPVSAHTGAGLDHLLEMVLLEADMMNLRANPDRMASGTVIEAELDKGRGPIATILVQNGTLHLGDIVVAGEAVGRVRSMLDENGKEIEQAGPSVPVEVMGLGAVPGSGDAFNAVTNEKLARELVEQRKEAAKEERFSAHQKVTLDNLFSHLAEGEMKTLNIIVKGDVQGSVEALRQSLEELGNEEVRLSVIHGAVGAISESDVMLASTSNSIIVGFNVRPEPLAAEAAERDEVDMRFYKVIYEAIEEIESAMKGMLDPKIREVNHGRAEVRQVYKVTGVGTIAGSYVLDGKITRSDLIRVVRDGIIIFEDEIDSLKRFKDDAKEVAQGYECGIGLKKFNDIHEGDVLESYIVEEYRD